MSERATALERVLERMALKKVEQYRIDDYPQLADAVWGFWCDTVREVLRGQPTALPPGDAPQTCEWRPIATCPKDGSDFVGGKYHGVYGWYWGRCAWESGRAGEDGYVRGDVPFATHWTSPPPPPVEGQTP